ncbi:hypothetical protein [Aeromonas sp. MdU4]|uniref:hypothetical protein n=1 Tax=Aeromonas sp. MdU4 TaxID=3342819 RepID=UPI0035B7B19F
MTRTLLLVSAAIAAYALQQSHTLLPLLSLLILLSLWVVSEIRQFFRDLPAGKPDEPDYYLDV